MMIFLFLAAVIAALDLGIKRYIDRNKEIDCNEPHLGGHIIITRFHNDGAMLGFLGKYRKFLLGISLLFLGILTGGLFESVKAEDSMTEKLGFAFMIGGALSNVADRVFRKKVTDYFRIDIGIKKLKRVIFNIGDFALFTGLILLVIGELKK